MKITKSDHGRKVTCVIQGDVVKDAKLSIDANGSVYICQNEHDGSDVNDKLGYQYSWHIGSVTEIRLSFYDTEDLKFVDEGARMGRRTFRLLKEDAELKKGALVQEACDDGDQEYVALNRDDLKFPDDTDEYFDGVMPSFGRTVVENQPKFFEEVVPATPLYVTKAEQTALRNYLKLAAKRK